MRRISAAVSMAGARAWLGASALLLGIALAPASAAGALAVAVSPLNGTPDAFPYTQISFLGVPSNEISGVSVVGSRTGSHPGRLEGYVSASGASFVPLHPFAQGERVVAAATVGARGHTQRVSTTFYVARLSGYRPPAAGAPAPAR